VAWLPFPLWLGFRSTSLCYLSAIAGMNVFHICAMVSIYLVCNAERYNNICFSNALAAYTLLLYVLWLLLQPSFHCFCRRCA
jgi:hypothetical protein